MISLRTSFAYGVPGVFDGPGPKAKFTPQPGLRIVGSSPTLTADAYKDNFGPAVTMDLASDPIFAFPIFTGNGKDTLIVESP